MKPVQVPAYLDRLHQALLRTGHTITGRPEFRVVVTGNRHADGNVWRPVVWRCMGLIRARIDPRPLRVAQGGATGIDRLAMLWTLRQHIARPDRVEEPHTYPVRREQWRQIGRGAGHARNGLMLDSEQPDLVLAINAGSPGTENCLTQASRRGLVTVRITVNDLDSWVPLETSIAV